jgi:hypothetical protein
VFAYGTLGLAVLPGHHLKLSLSKAFVNGLLGNVSGLEDPLEARKRPKLEQNPWSHFKEHRMNVAF